MNTIPFKSSRVRAAVKSALGTTAVAVPLLFATLPAAAQTTSPDDTGTLQDLRDQIEEMEQRLDMMEADEDGGAFKLGDTTVDFSGYIKLDAIYDLEADQGATLLPSDVIASGGLDGYEDKDANLGWTAKQTRLNIATTTPTAIGDIGGFIQMDMYGEPSNFGTTNGGGPRLRLAYVTWDNWTIGRNWTTFSNFFYGTSLNFAGPAGQVFSRQEQIRYTVDLAGGGTFDIALEDDAGNGSVADQILPDGGDPDALPDVVGPDTDNSLPALAMRYQGAAGIVDFQVAGLVRSIEAENAAGDEESAFGWGLNTGGSVELATGTTLMLTGAYGEGIGNYIYTATFGPAAYFDGGELETNRRYGVIGSISQAWTDQLASNLVYGYSNIQAGPDEDEATGTSLSVNLLYSPIDPLTFGIEYARVTAELDASGPGGEIDGDANRVQFATIYSF